MQTKKESVRKALLKSARKEFLKHGFNGSDMRNIAKGSGKTVGNCYRYYKNKEELFDAVAPAGRLTVEMFKNDPQRFYLLAERRISSKGLVKFLKTIDPEIILGAVK